MLTQVVGVALLILGLFFFAVGTLGILRLPDVFSRLHATTKGDTLGAGCVLVGLMLLSGWSWSLAKLLFILVFIWLTTPTAAHCIARGELSRQRREGQQEGVQ